MAYKILDISKYQPNVDYAATAKDVDGVILRIGLTYWGAQAMGKDECFEQHYAGFKAVGCPIGVYYYSCADTVAMAEKEAAYCLELMKGKQFELPVYYDVENNQRQGALSKALLTTIVDTFCSKVEKAGYYVGFYASTNWLLNKMDTATLSKKYTLWKADYRTAYDKTIPCDMHQYTSGATVAGINARVDMSNCTKDFVSVIKNKGLNGFKAQGVDPVVPEGTYEPVRLLIGPMSKGDILTFVTYLGELNIPFEQTTGGYIVTNHTISYKAVVAIEDKASEIGNIDVQEYVVDTSKPEQCAECDLLEAKIAELEKLLAAEKESREGFAQTAKQLSSELSAVNSALTAEKAITSMYSHENEQMKEKLTHIAEIVGG